MAEPAPARANINPNSHVRHHAVSPRPPAVARNRCSTADPPCYHMTRRDMTPDRHRFNAVYIVNLLQLCVFLDTRCAPPREPDQLPESNVLGPPQWLLHPQHLRIGQMQRSSGHRARQRTVDVAQAASAITIACSVACSEFGDPCGHLAHHDVRFDLQPARSQHGPRRLQRVRSPSPAIAFGRYWHSRSKAHSGAGATRRERRKKQMKKRVQAQPSGASAATAWKRAIAPVRKAEYARFLRRWQSLTAPRPAGFGAGGAVAFQNPPAPAVVAKAAGERVGQPGDDGDQAACASWR